MLVVREMENHFFLGVLTWRVGLGVGNIDEEAIRRVYFYLTYILSRIRVGVCVVSQLVDKNCPGSVSPWQTMDFIRIKSMASQGLDQRSPCKSWT